MLEKIKKEISKLNIHECDIEDIFEILDKHNNQPDYKSDIELFNLANKTLKDEADTLNKGIDELLIKYEEIYELYSDKKFGDAVIYKQIIIDLKKLKGE